MGEDDWLPIKYFGFWDVPRSFVVAYRSRLYLFDSAFDDAADDYAHVFTVYQLPIELLNQMEKVGQTQLESITREHLAHYRVEVGRILVAHVQFDQSRRRFMHSAAFHELGSE